MERQDNNTQNENEGRILTLYEAADYLRTSYSTVSSCCRWRTEGFQAPLWVENKRGGVRCLRQKAICRTRSHTQNGRKVSGPSFEYAHYQPNTFTTLPDALVDVLVDRRAGRNGWAVMTTLCKMTFVDGRFGVIAAKRVSEQTGLILAQVARGMRELRQRGIIAPVLRKNRLGYRYPDKSCCCHVAQYCICKDIWEKVELKPPKT